MRDDTALNSFLNTLPGWLIELRKMQEAKAESKAQRETQASQFAQQMGLSNKQFIEMKDQFTRGLAAQANQQRNTIKSNANNAIFSMFGPTDAINVGDDGSISMNKESFPEIQPTGDISGSYGMTGSGDVGADLKRMMDIQNAINRGNTTQQVKQGVPMAMPPTLAQLAQQAAMGHEKSMQDTSIASNERMQDTGIASQERMQGRTIDTQKEQFGQQMQLERDQLDQRERMAYADMANANRLQDKQLQAASQQQLAAIQARRNELDQTYSQDVKKMDRGYDYQREATRGDQAFQTNIMNQQYQNELGKMGASFGYQQQATAGDQAFQSSMADKQNQQQMNVLDKQGLQQSNILTQQGNQAKDFRATDPRYPLDVSATQGALSSQDAYQQISTFPNRTHKTNRQLVNDVQRMYELATQYRIQIPDYVLKSIKSKTKKITGWGGTGDYFDGTRKSVRESRKAIEELNRSLAGAAGLLQQTQ